MTAITIPGLTPDAITNADTTPKTASFAFFPANATSWTRFTAEIMAAEVKIIGEDEFLALTVQNGPCKQELLISLDLNKTNPQSKKTEQEQFDEKRETLLVAMKLTGCYNAKGQLDTSNLQPARFCEFDAKIQKSAKYPNGWREYNGSLYPNIKAYFRGEAAGLVAVLPLDLEKARAGVARPMAAAPAVDDDIPF